MFYAIVRKDNPNAILYVKDGDLKGRLFMYVNYDIANKIINLIPEYKRNDYIIRSDVKVTFSEKMEIIE